MKHYAQKDADGKLTQTIHTTEVLGDPWILLDQDCVCSGMIWDESTQKFIEPTPDP